MKVEIYSKDNCGWCSMAIKLAEREQYDTTVKKLNEDFTRDELLAPFPDAKSFPIVVVDGKTVGGFKEFDTFIKENKEA